MELKEFHLDPMIAALHHCYSPDPLLLREAKEQVSGHSPISSQTNVLETLFKIDMFLGSDVHGIVVGFHIVHFEKNHSRHPG